jgi:hypothetical protein
MEKRRDEPAGTGSGGLYRAHPSDDVDSARRRRQRKGQAPAPPPGGAARPPF